MALKQFLFNLSTVLAIIIVGLWLNPAVGNVTVDPFGITVSLEAEEADTIEMTLANDGESDVSFNIRYAVPEEEERRQPGPRRDDIGDIIEEFNLGNAVWNGLAWDGELMWAITYESRMMAVDLEGEVQVQNVQIPQGCTGMCYDGEAFWFGSLENPELLHYDREGDRLGSIRIPNGNERMGAFGVAWDGENLWYACPEAEDRSTLGQISVGGEHIRDVNCQHVRGAEWASIVWVPAHDDGHMWLLGCEANTVYQLNVVEDRAEIMQQAQFERGTTYGIGHDETNLWLHAHDGVFYTMDDGLEEPKWIICDPEEGGIDAEGELPIDVIFTPGEMEAGIYEMRILIEFAEAEEDEVQSIIEISAVMSVDTETGSITGVVTDAATDEPVTGVNIDMDRYLISRSSGEEGNYTFENLPFANYELTFTVVDYLPYVEEVALDDEEVVHDIALLHSECNLDVEEIIRELPPNANTQVNFNVSNDGNGPLSYTVERRLIGDVDADPWEIRRQYPAGDVVDDNRVQGAVLIDDLFYVAGSNDREPVIYVMSQEGELLDQFDQPGDDGQHGFRDMAWDGQCIWGSGENTIYAINTAGEVMQEFEGPFRPNHNFAWDNDRNLLWVSSTTSDIVGIDRNGNNVAELNRCGLRVYGLAYWLDDPDGYPLYIFHKDNDIGDQVIFKMNPDEGDTMFVRVLEPEDGGSPIGAFITNQYDIYSWVFMAVVNNAAQDRIDVWQLDVRKEWFTLDPAEGVIVAGENQEFELTLDAADLPSEQFVGELVFLHDGVGGETRLPVTLNVVEGPYEDARAIQLDVGWNMVSINLQPDPDDIRAVTQDLVEADILLLMKDGLGRFYSPEHNFCNIPGWNVADGYQLKMEDEAELMLEGMTVMADDPIQLGEGWNMISYYPREPVDAVIALSGIVDQLIMAKDGFGRFYNPQWGFSNMGNMLEGSGYQVKVSEDVELVYRLEEEDDNLIASCPNQQGKLPVHPVTGNNMSLLLIDDHQLSIYNCQMTIEIGVYADGLFVGSGILEDGVCGIAIWGDDPTTPEVDGALQDQPLTISISDQTGLRDVSFKTLAGENLYTTDGFWAIELDGVAEIPTEFGIVSAYPNPFNSRTVVKYALPEAGMIDLSVFDLTGRQVMELASDQLQAGMHSVTIDGEALTSGIYFVELQSAQHVSKSKIVLLK